MRTSVSVVVTLNTIHDLEDVSSIFLIASFSVPNLILHARHIRVHFEQQCAWFLSPHELNWTIDDWNSYQALTISNCNTHPFRQLYCISEQRLNWILNVDKNEDLTARVYAKCAERNGWCIEGETIKLSS